MRLFPVTGDDLYFFRPCSESHLSRRMRLLHQTKGAGMEKNTTVPEYEAPRIEDHGNLTELTAAGSPYGSFDASYNAGEPIPSGGAGNSTTP